ncbi:hypothetical protein ACFSWD_28375 [Paenibacillus xanthanilyticus]
MYVYNSFELFSTMFIIKPFFLLVTYFVTISLGISISPFPLALYAGLPDKHVAINKVWLPSGKDASAFIADMVPPPKRVKVRKSRCSSRTRRGQEEETSEVTELCRKKEVILEVCGIRNSIHSMMG